MIPRLLRAIFGSRNDRLLKSYGKTAARINALEPEVAALSDSALAAKTVEFKQRVANGEELDALLPEAFDAMKPFLTEAFGNASSLHQHGLRARDALAKAREQDVPLFIEAWAPW